MPQQRPLQPQFRISVKGPSEQFADITRYIDWGVEYEENADMTRTLSFTVGKQGHIIIERLHLYQEVEFYGGTVENFPRLFTGIIHRLQPICPKEGAVKIKVECLTLSWNKLARDIMRNNVYPSKLATRTFNAADTMKVSDMVKGICKENGVQVGSIDIPPTADIALKQTNMMRQHFTSDWAFLYKLARFSGCTLWTEMVNNQEVLYFRDRSKVRNQAPETDISFRYMIRSGEYDQAFEVTKLDPNQQLIWDVTIDEQIADATAVQYAGSRYDFKTGEEINLLAESIADTSGKIDLTYWELDEKKVADLEKTDPQFAAELRNMGTYNYIPWTTAKLFYRQIHVIDEQANIYDQAFFGVTITATTMGNVSIHSQRGYQLYGILRYATPNKKTGLYWLYGLKHMWNEDGFLTTLTFRK